MRTRVLLVIAIAAWPGLTAAQQPLVPRVQSTPPDAGRPATMWTAVFDATGESTSPPDMHGPAVHLAAGSTAIEAQANTTVEGRYRVRATFLPRAGTTGGYGLSVGTPASHLEIVVRPDRQWGVRRHDVSGLTVLQPWTTPPLSSSPQPAQIVEVEVNGATVTVRMDGRVAGTFAITAGALDGRPGLHVEPGADVMVSSLTIERAATGGGQ